MSTLKDLDDILGEELAEKALAGAAAHSKDVEGTGAEFKGDEVEGAADPDVGDESAEGAETETKEPEDKVAEPEVKTEELDEGDKVADDTETDEDERGDTVVREIVFSDESIGALADAIAAKLGTKELADSFDKLTDAVTVLAKSDEERIEAKIAKLPKAVIRDSKKGDAAPLKDDEVVETGSEEKSEEDEVTDAREKAYKGFIK